MEQYTFDKEMYGSFGGQAINLSIYQNLCRPKKKMINTFNYKCDHKKSAHWNEKWDKN